MKTKCSTEVSMTCPFCRKPHSVMVDFVAYCDWCEGKLIQKAMPDLTPTEREQLISGLCPSCQDIIFGD